MRISVLYMFTFTHPPERYMGVLLPIYNIGRLTNDGEQSI